MKLLSLHWKLSQTLLGLTIENLQGLVTPCVLLAITFLLNKYFHTLVRTFSLSMHRKIVIFPLNHLSTYSYPEVVLC